MKLRYTPGEGVLLAGPSTVALLAITPDSPLTGRLWPLIESAAQLPMVLDALLASGVRDLPDLALVVSENGRHTAVLHGTARLVVGERELTAEDAVLWREERIVDGTEVTLQLPGSGTASFLPTGHGVVLAGSAVVSTDQPQAGPACTARGVHHRRQAAVGDETAAVTDMEPRAGHDVGDATVAPVEAEPSVAPTPALSASEVETGPVPSAGVSADDDLPNYDHMFRTMTAAPEPPPELCSPVESAPVQRAPVESAPVQRAAVESAPVQTAPVEMPSVEVSPAGSALAPGPSASAVRDGQSCPTPAPRTQSTPNGDGSRSGLIDAVPGVASGAFVPSAAAGRVGTDAEVDDRTVSKEEHLAALARLSRQGQVAEGDRVGPLVHAVRCPGGHLSDPQRELCRICGQPLPDVEPVTAPRPLLGQLALSTGEIVLLDRSVVFGRKPRVESRDEERPHLVQVDNPAGDVSRNHVAVRLDGWHVLVEDLRSTNGTLVELPGQAPQRLRPDQPVSLEPGTSVTLAEGVSFVFEVTG